MIVAISVQIFRYLEYSKSDELVKRDSYIFSTFFYEQLTKAPTGAKNEEEEGKSEDTPSQKLYVTRLSPNLVTHFIAASTN